MAQFFLLACVSSFFLWTDTVLGADACGDGRTTAADVEGPYYLRGAPIRDDFVICSGRQDGPEPPSNITISGRVTDEYCNGVAALLDVWQANQVGDYSGFQRYGTDCRGKIQTDAGGYFRFQTIVPGRYYDNGWRPSHIHFKVSSKELISHQDVLTTQLYFPGDPYNGPADSCGICHSGHATLRADFLSDSSKSRESGAPIEASWNVILRGNKESASSSSPSVESAGSNRQRSKRTARIRNSFESPVRTYH